MPQRYVLTLMGFLGLVCAYAMNLVLSVAITQMVPPPIIVANLTGTNDGPICPYIDYNYNEEHFDYEAILDSLYNSVRGPAARVRCIYSIFFIIIFLFSFRFLRCRFGNLVGPFACRGTKCLIGRKSSRESFYRRFTGAT